MESVIYTLLLRGLVYYSPSIYRVINPTIAAVSFGVTSCTLWICVPSILEHQCYNNMHVLHSSELSDHFEPATATPPTVSPSRVRPVNAETSDYSGQRVILPTCQANVQGEIDWNDSLWSSWDQSSRGLPDLGSVAE